MDKELENGPRRVLLLGGGPHQLEGVRTAKRIGLTTVVMDGNKDAPGLAEADIPIAESFTNIDRAIIVAKENEVSGVITISTEVGVVPCARIAAALSLPGISIEAAEAVTDKVKMRTQLTEAGLPCPRFKGINTLEKATAFADEIGYPCIIKPSIGSGSRGVKKLTEKSQMAEAFTEAKEKSRNAEVIIEEYLLGEEVHVDCLASNGKVVVLGIADKVRTPEPYRSDITVTYPAKFSPELEEEVQRQAIVATKALNIHDGTSHTELLVHESEARIVEVAARGAGFNVFTTILKRISGIDPVEAVIRMAVGEQPDINPTEKRSAILSFFTITPGVLKSVTGIEKARAMDGVVEVDVTITPGERITPYRCGDDRIGHIIVEGETRDETEALKHRVLNTINFKVDTGE